MKHLRCFILITPMVLAWACSVPEGHLVDMEGLEQASAGQASSSETSNESGGARLPPIRTLAVVQQRVAVRQQVEQRVAVGQNPHLVEDL